jgi:hypothetical protein
MFEKKGDSGGGGSVLVHVRRLCGVESMVSIIAVKFDSASSAFRIYQSEELVDAFGGHNGWSTGNVSNLKEKAVELLEYV